MYTVHRFFLVLPDLNPAPVYEQCQNFSRGGVMKWNGLTSDPVRRWSWWISKLQHRSCKRIFDHKVPSKPPTALLPTTFWILVEQMCFRRVVGRPTSVWNKTDGVKLCVHRVVGSRVVPVATDSVTDCRLSRRISDRITDSVNDSNTYIWSSDRIIDFLKV